jgi:uncharacterized protein
VPRIARITARPISRALITGASAGLGAEFARQLADRGTSLVLVARWEDALESLAAELRSSEVEVEVLAADLIAPDARATVERRLADTAKPVDLLVNNAGFGTYGDFVDLDADGQQALIELNVTALVRLAHAAAGGMSARQQGGIINVASTAAFQPCPHGAVYGASKAFVLSFSEALHEELAPRGVRVTALCPGYTETEFQAVAGVAESGLLDTIAMSAEPVVRAGLDGFTRGKAVVVPGLANAVTARSAGLVPRVVSRRLSKLVHARFAGR